MPKAIERKVFPVPTLPYITNMIFVSINSKLAQVVRRNGARQGDFIEAKAVAWP